MQTEQTQHRPRLRPALRVALLTAALAAAGCSAPGMRMDAVADRNSNPGGADTRDIAKRTDLYDAWTGG